MTNAHRKKQHQRKDDRQDRVVRVRGVQRENPDPKRIGEVVALALAQAEKDAREAKRRRDERRSA